MEHGHVLSCLTVSMRLYVQTIKYTWKMHMDARPHVRRMGCRVPRTTFILDVGVQKTPPCHMM